jgi:hypothetical protein
MTAQMRRPVSVRLKDGSISFYAFFHQIVEKQECGTLRVKLGQQQRMGFVVRLGVGVERR